MSRFLCFVVAFVAAAPSLGAQQLASRSPSTRPAPAVVPMAVRAEAAPVIDGKGDDAVWASAQLISGFRQMQPVEDGEPAFPTEARLIYDDRNLYVLVRAFDPHPDSIVALLSRRDVTTQSDRVVVVIDSYHDRRTGYHFAVNAAGVQRDIYHYGDTNEDDSWNAVWESATSIDGKGWTAEFRIPLNQLRFPNREEHTFGLAIGRDIARLNQTDTWPLLRRTQFGVVSQFGEIGGIRGIGGNRRVELMPYTVAANDSRPEAGGWGRASRGAVGGDLKVGLSSNLTLDATINPDFGQVEADPAVLNLSAFEQFFQERRPFFLEGTGIFSFNLDCEDDVCRGPFYSRRIGRAPQVGFLSGDSRAVPASSTILGAAKITGRLSNGLSIGVLNAVTGRESVSDSLTVEPRTNYFVTRLQQDLRGGRSGVGLIVTSVDRDLDAVTSQYLRRRAWSYGIDARHRFGPGQNYEVSGHVLGSHVTGSAEAIAATQRTGVHLFQRPGDDLLYDTTRTALSGSTTSLDVSKTGGGIVRFVSGVSYRTPGFEINDVGFTQRANSMLWFNWVGLRFQKPRAFYRMLGLNFNQWNSWFADGVPNGRGGNVNAHSQLKNMWFVYGGIGGELPASCGACLRGGPLMWEQSRLNWWVGVGGDERRSVTPSLQFNGGRADNGRSHRLSVSPGVSVRVASSFSTSVRVNWSRNIDDRQWLGNYGAVGSDTTHHTLAHLSQQTVSLGSRINWTASPTLSLQFYAEPFVTGGDYTNWRRVSAPNARSYDEQTERFTQRGDPGGFNYKQFRSNTVLRWEYRPGSTLFLVWQQGRTQDGVDAGTFDWQRDGRGLFRAHPENTLLLKASYWLSM